MSEPDSTPPVGQEPGANGAPLKPKFKTNNVNLMFKATATESSSDLANPDRDSVNAGLSNSTAPAASKPSANVQNGVLTLGKKKDASATPPIEAETGKPSEATKVTLGDAIATTTPPTDATTEDSGDLKPEEPKKPANEEVKKDEDKDKLPESWTNSRESWEDEEGDWVPPPAAFIQQRSRLYSQNSMNQPRTTNILPSNTTNTSNSTPAPAPRARTESQNHDDGPAWGSKPAVPVAKSLSQTIKEAKEKGPTQPHGIQRAPGLASRAQAVAAAGGDALSRFRINAPVRHVGGRAPPLNPRVFESKESYNAPLPQVDTLFLNAKPRRALNEPEDPSEKERHAFAPRRTSRPEEVAPSAPAAPAPAAPAAKPVPKPALVPEPVKEEPVEDMKTLKEKQKEEMQEMLLQVKLRKEAEMTAEKEKQERLAKMREQYHKEMEEKKKAESLKEKAEVEKKKAELEKRLAEQTLKLEKKAAERAKRLEKERALKKVEEESSKFRAETGPVDLTPVPASNIPKAPKSWASKTHDLVFGVPVAPHTGHASHSKEADIPKMFVNLPKGDNFSGAIDLTPIIQAETAPAEFEYDLPHSRPYFHTHNHHNHYHGSKKSYRPGQKFRKSFKDKE